jgi:hypothetical protein
MKHFLKQFDIYSRPVTFFIDGDDKYKTWAGFWFTAITLVFSITLSFLFGKDIYERKNPTTNFTTKYEDQAYLNFYNFPLYFMYSDGRGNIMEDLTEYLDVRVDNYFYVNGRSTGIKTRNNITKCTVEHFKNITDKISSEQMAFELSNKPLYCITFQEGFNYAKNPYKSHDSAYIHISYKFCNETIRKCPDDMEIVKSESYLQLFFMDAYVNSHSYTNPVNYYLTSINQQLSKDFLEKKFSKIRNS